MSMGGAPSADGTSEPRPRGLSRLRRTGARVLLAVGGPLLLVAALEFGLRLIGYGHPTAFFLRTPAGDAYTENPDFCRQFFAPGRATAPYPLLLPAAKPTGAVRIFVLGESAAAGTPDPAYSFSRILQLVLAQQYPDKRFEVINTAVIGINSYVILRVAEDCARLQPDLFIVYMGNNEVPGLHGPGLEAGILTRWLPVIRVLQKVRSSRLGQWTGRLKEKLTQRGGTEDAAFFRGHRVAANGPILAMTLGPAFAGQLEHARRQQAAELALRESIAKLGAKDIRRSVDVYRAAVALAPNDWRLRHNFGRLLFNVGQYSAAADQLAAAARLMPHAREVRLLMGEALAKAGRRNEAIRPQYR